MLKKKQKKHSLSDYLRYMHMIEDGYSFGFICDHYGSSEKTLKVLWHRYQEFGVEGLMKNELLYANKYEKIEDFESALRRYIDWYNNKRIKLRLKGMSPVQYRAHYYRELNN